MLYYLIRGYTGVEGLDQGEARAALEEQGVMGPREVEELATMTIYSTAVSWQMFVPPLPSHQGWPTDQGWCLMCDVLLRLPLSIFVKLVNITFDLAGLEEYLGHPVRRHYLLRALPHHVRNKLLFQRKYIFAVHEVAILTSPHLTSPHLPSPADMTSCWRRGGGGRGWPGRWTG